jgi:hypothetical protein
LLLASILAGLCFGAKQNLGLCALAALLGSIVVAGFQRRTSWSETAKTLLTALAVFMLVGMAMILPVLLSGGIDQFIDYGFINKRTYLRIGGFSYVEGLRALARRVWSIRSLEDLRWVYLQTSFLLPLLAVAILVLATVVGTWRQRAQLAIISLFTGAALIGVYPRADIEHLLYAIPSVLLCAVYASTIVSARLPRPLRHLARTTFILWCVLGIVLIGSGAVGRIMSPNFERSTLPHFRNVWLAKREHAKLHRYTAALRAEAQGGQLFILNSQAAFYYLVADLANPTPFDYPLETAFGLHGQAAVMAAIKEAQISTVCLKSAPRYQMAAHSLAQFVVDHMEQGRKLEFCTLYHTGAGQGQERGSN